MPSTGPTGLATRTQERHAAVQTLLAAGASVSAISQNLGLDRKTVRRFARAGCVAELLTVHSRRASAAPLRPLPQRTTSDTNAVQRRDRLGGLLHEYQQVA